MNCWYCLNRDPYFNKNRLFLRSLLSQERGLKFFPAHAHGAATLSLLSQERGLKFPMVLLPKSGSQVAPLAGAWIEITRVLLSSSTVVSLLSQERGLKYGIYEFVVIFSCRSSRRSVD